MEDSFVVSKNVHAGSSKIRLEPQLNASLEAVRDILVMP